MFLRLESKIQKNLFFSLATVCLLFFGTGVHAIEPLFPGSDHLTLLLAIPSTENIFAEYLQQIKSLEPLKIPKDINRKALNRILGISFKNGTAGLAIQIKNLAEVLLFLQARLCNIISIENILYKQWQKTRTECEEFFANITPAPENIFPMSIPITGDVSPIDILPLTSIESLTTLMFLQSNYEHGDGLIEIGNIDLEVLHVLSSSPNENIKILGESILLLKKCHDSHNAYINYYAKKTPKLYKEIEDQYKTITETISKALSSKCPKFGKTIQLPFFVFLRKTIKFLATYWNHLLAHQKNAAKIDIYDEQYFEARSELCQSYLENKYNFERLYDEIRQARASNKKVNPLLKIIDREAMPETIREPINIETLLMEERLEQESILGEEGLSQLITHLQDINEEYKVAEHVIPQKEPQPPKKAKRKRRKKKAPAKTETELREELEAANEQIIKDAVQSMVETIVKEVKEEEQKKKRRAEAASEASTPKPKPEIVYKPAIDGSKAHSETPTHVSIDDPKNSNSIINLYKVSQKNIEPFKFTYDVRVDGWFINPSKQLSIEINHHSQNYNNREYYDENPDEKSRIIAIHSFAKAIDPYIFKYGFKTTKQTSRGERLNIVVPGELLLENQTTEYGYFIYGFYADEDGRQVCYHRTFTKVAPSKFIASISAGGREAVTAEILGEFF